MPDQNQKTSTRRLHRHLLRTFCWLLGILCFFFLAAGIILNHFGEHLIKRYLQRRILVASKGVYQVDFDRFSFNILSGKTIVTGFRMVPNERRYQELREKGEAKGTLYSIDYAKLILNNLDIREMFIKRAIHLRLIELEKPTISFIAFPDSAARKRGPFYQIYRDIYPVLSLLFSEVKVDSIIVLDGSFSGKQTRSSGETSEGDWLYSVILRDFDLTSSGYHPSDRVFYSRDVELRIHKFRYFLADSLYLLTADEVGFSLAGSRLFGKGLSLTPDFKSASMARTNKGHFYQVYLPEFTIEGLDLYKAFLEREISVGAIRLDDLEIKMFYHMATGPVHLNDRAKLTVATLYSIMRGKVKQVAIDTLFLRRASFRYYPFITSAQPEVKVDRAILSLEGFLLDSLAHLDTTKIFYARDIRLNLEGFTLALKDRLHHLHSGEVEISTHDSLIDIRETRLFPSPGTGPPARFKGNSFFQMYFPQVRLEKVDLLRMFNTRNLELSRISVYEPDMTVVQYKGKQHTGDDRNTRGTFLGKLDLIRSLVIPYLVSLDAGKIEISNARISFRDDREGVAPERISGLADLTLTGFHVDTLAYRNPLEFLSAVDFYVEVRDFHYLSPDSLHRVSFRELAANTASQDLDITGFDMYSTSVDRAGLNHPSTLTARFTSLSVHKFNHRKWISDKFFSAREIRLVEPVIVVRSVRKKRESTLNEPFAETDEAVKKIEIGNIRIENGLFDLAEEYPSSKSSLLVRNFGFQLSGLLFDLTRWDEGIRSLRYDHLSIKPDPELPVLLDSMYAISFSRFLSDSYPPDLAVSQLHLSPVIDSPRDMTGEQTVELSVPSLLVRKLDLEKVLFEREVILEEIRITKPEITIVRGLHDKKQNFRKPGVLTVHPELKTPFHRIDIGKISLTGGMVHYRYRESGKTVDFSLDRVTADIRGFRYDSVRATGHGAPLFYCDDIDLRSGGFSMLSKDSLNTLSFGEMHFTTGGATFTLDSLAFIPNFSDFDYSRKLGYQTDRIKFTTGKITLERLDPVSLFGDRKVRAGCATIESLVLDDYRDKRVEFPEWKRPPMIQQAIRRIPFPVSIDTVRVNEGNVTYREQTGEEAGMIFFDNMYLLARNFTSDSVAETKDDGLIVEFTTRLMGKTPAYGRFLFPMNSRADTFFFAGKAGQMDLTMFNPMLDRVTPFRIRSGIVDSLNVHSMQGDSSFATGLLDLYYHGLSVELSKKNRNFLDLIGADIIQFLADLAIPSDNPGYLGKHRSGYIWNSRNTEKGFLNFYWKSLFSGLKSSIGLNTREQREIKKGEK